MTSDDPLLKALETCSTPTKPTKPTEASIRRSVPLTPKQTFALLVACMSDHEDRLLKLGVFESNQEIVDLLNWKEGFEGLDAGWKQKLMGVWTEVEVWE